MAVPLSCPSIGTTLANNGMRATWPIAPVITCFEPAYGCSFASGHQQSIGVSLGDLSGENLQRAEAKTAIWILLRRSCAELGRARVLISSVIAALTTERLILRQWRDSDREPFRRMNADAAVMEFMPKRLPAEESDVLADRIQRRLAERGFGLFAAELRETGSFIGFVGLSAPAFEAHFTPCVEIGWRLAREFWGSGYATEGAYAVLRLAFMSLELPEVVSFTAASNERSRRVMKRLGMVRNTEDDFDHPHLSAADPLRPHVLYRLARVNWLPNEKAVSERG